MCIMYVPHHSIPANTAIYQSAAAFVFIISVPLLKERVTLVKASILLHEKYACDRIERGNY